MYGMDGNFDALAWLVFCGHGRTLSEKDKVAMREAGFMDANDCMTLAAEIAYKNQTQKGEAA